MTSEALHSALQASGLRVTAQRLSVLRVLAAERRHLSADAIVLELGRYSGVSRASVYNILRSLTGAGLVRPLTLGSETTLFEYAHDDHIHFRCRACGMVEDSEPIPTRTIPLPKAWRAKMEHLEVVVHGVCAGCEKSLRKRRK